MVLWNQLEDISSHMLRLPGCSWGKVCRCTFIRTIYTILYSISFHWSHFLGRAEERVAKLVDSPDRPESEASYKLDEGGWADVWTFLINDTLLRSFVFFKILSLLSLSLERALKLSHCLATLALVATDYFSSLVFAVSLQLSWSYVLYSPIICVYIKKP